MEDAGKEGLRAPTFPGSLFKARAKPADPESPDPTEWNFGDQPLAKPLRPLAGIQALKLKPEREEDQLPCALAPDARDAGTPNVGTRTCMRCWMSVAPLYCSQCSKYYCGPCAAKAHGFPETQHHKVGTAVRGEVVQVSLPRTLIEQMHGDSFALDLPPAAGRTVQCPLHNDEPARFACLDCRCAVLCSQCYAEGLHVDHELVNIRTAVPSVRLKMMDQYTKLKQQAQTLEGFVASLKSVQKKAAKIVSSNALQMREAFESVVRALDVRGEAIAREMDIIRNLSAQSLKSLDVDCQTLLRYLRLKKQQLAQLRVLASRSHVLALNAFGEIAPTIEALDEKSDYLEDMRERLRVPHWQLRVLEIDGLLQDRQNALVDLSARVNNYCENATVAVEDFVRLALPLEGTPAEHREIDQMTEALETKRLPPVIYTKGMDPYSERFLKHSPEKFQAFVRKDQLHAQWEIRVVSLRGPYLLVHASEEDPFAPVESASLLTKNTFARTFSDPGITAIAELAKKDYPHGIEVVTVDVRAKELQSFLLLAADGQQLAEEWVDAIEDLCAESLGLEPEAPGHNPNMTLEDLKVEAAGIPFPVTHRRQAALLPVDLVGDKVDDELSGDSSEGDRYTDTDYPSISDPDSMGDMLTELSRRQRRTNSRPSSFSSESDRDSEEAAEEALIKVAAPNRPAVRREETQHWDKDVKPGALYKRRQQRKGRGVGQHKDTAETSEDSGDRSTPSGSSSSEKAGMASLSEATVTESDAVPLAGDAPGEGEESDEDSGSSVRTPKTPNPRNQSVMSRVGAIDASTSPPKVQKAPSHRSSPPQIETLDFAPTPEIEETAPISSRRSSAGDCIPNSGSSSGSSSESNNAGTPGRAFKLDPQLGDSPPLRKQQGGAPSAAAHRRPAESAEVKTAAATMLVKTVTRGTVLNGLEPSSLHSAVSVPANERRPAPEPPLKSPTQSAGSPLRRGFSYTAGLLTPRERRQQRQGGSGAPIPPEGEFLRLKMPPTKAIPTFVPVTSQQPSPRPKPSDATAANASSGEEAEGTRVRVRRVVAHTDDPVAQAAAVAAVVAASGAVTPRVSRRLLSLPALPSPPPGTADLAVRDGSSRSRRLQEDGAKEAELVKRVLQQIGSLKISSAAQPLLKRSATFGSPKRQQGR